MRILVVDDDKLDRLAVRRCLQQAGIAAEIDEAASAAEATERVQPGSYDCVLLDYLIPGSDTVALVRSLAGQAGDVPVVILTGRGDEDIAVEFMKAGAADYLPKEALSAERLATSFRYAQESARNAAARQRAEVALREREAEFRTLANAISQMAWMADTQGRRYWYNQRWYEFTGLRPDESLGLGWYLAYHPDQRATLVASQAAKFGQGQSWEETVRLRRRDGEYRWFLARAMPVRGEDGTILRWVGTETDITEQKEAQLERERLLDREQAARKEAERAARARDDMLAIVAHDLRNPIQNIATAAAGLSGAGEDKRMRLVGVIHRSTEEMERLIADLFDVARIESGTLSITKSHLDVRALLAEACERFEPQALARNIALGCETPAGLAALGADRDRLSQALSNLIGNALKFTPAGGRISLRAANEEGAVRISVEDTGIGIPPENLPHVFDRFWQASRASRAGAGLGLAICKGIVEAHGGRIWAISTEGGGTSIHITLPAEAAASVS
ncbi:MAG TPA: ATP-binding protein [Burkholderiales bacterium]|nr:ATP-binding protein [Burkholderiales bacterium]